MLSIIVGRTKSCALFGDTTTLVWSQLDPDDLNYQQLQTLLRERYGSTKQEEKYQAELRVRRRKIGEELPTLRVDITRLMLCRILAMCPP